MRRTAHLLLLLSALSGCSQPATVATFNIRFFPDQGTDTAAVARTIAETQAGVLAIQEIRNAHAFDEMLVEASAASGRDYRLVAGPCGGDGFELTTGVVYDAHEWSLVHSRGYPNLGDGDQCGPWLPATVAIVAKAGRRLAVASIHFAPFPKRYDERTRQWARAMELLDEVESEFHPEATMMMGDANSTGFRGEPPEEPDFVRGVVNRSKRELLTADMACTEYWRPPGAPRYEPSLLDHVVARGGRWGAPSERGLCARLQCQPTPLSEMDPEFESVSDHCPVVVAGKF